jgi:hypothetical protein
MEDLRVQTMVVIGSQSDTARDRSKKKKVSQENVEFVNLADVEAFEQFQDIKGSPSSSSQSSSNKLPWKYACISVDQCPLTYMQSKHHVKDQSFRLTRHVTDLITAMFTSALALTRETALVGSSDKSDSCVWLLDSGCTTHMNGIKDLFVKFRLLPNDESHVVTTADGKQYQATGTGTVRLFLADTCGSRIAF